LERRKERDREKKGEKEREGREVERERLRGRDQGFWGLERVFFFVTSPCSCS
jgi:hypothetical protein